MRSGSVLSKCYFYVITTKYGKESTAELELGDAIFPYDVNVEIKPTAFKGVLTLKTSLPFNELINILLQHPPATIMRIVKIDFCCKVNEDLLNCVNAFISRVSGDYSKVVWGRKGGLSKDVFKTIDFIAQRGRREGINSVLHIEPINDKVCFGIMKPDEDKFHKLRDKIITKL